MGFGSSARVEVIQEGVAFPRGRPMLAEVAPIPPGGDVFGEVGPAPFAEADFANHNRRRELPMIRLWMIHVVFLLLISAVSLWLAARRLGSPVVKMMKVRHKG